MKGTKNDYDITRRSRHNNTGKRRCQLYNSGNSRRGGPVMADVIQLPHSNQPAPKRGTPEYDAKYPWPELREDRTTEELYAEVCRSKLAGRGFSEAEVDWWMNAAKVRYCAMQETLNRFNVKTNQHGDRAEGLLVPYFDLDGKPALDSGRPFERVRLLNWSGGGKYRSEYGTTVHAYLPPLPHGKTWRGVFKDPTEVVAITEGEFKAGQSTIAPFGIPTIGLGGVDCLVTKAGLVPELAGMKLTDRTIFIVFDAPMTDGVRGGIQRAMNYLTARGAKVGPWVKQGADLTGEQLKQVDAELGQMARNLAGSTNTTEKVQAPAWREVQSYVRNAMEHAAATPEQHALLSKSNAAYRQLLALEKAILPGNETFTPRRLKMTLDRMGIKGTDLNRVADAMDKTLPNTVPNSGTAERLIANALPSLLMSGGAGASGLGFDTVGAGMMAAGALGSRPGARFMTGGLRGQPAIEAAVRTLRRGIPAATRQTNEEE